MARSVVLQLMADVRQFTSALGGAVRTADGAFRKIGAGAQQLGTGMVQTTQKVGKMAGAFNILGGNILRNTVFFAGYFQALIAINGVMTAVINHAFNLDEGLRKVQSITKESNESIAALKDQLLELARKGELAGKTAAEIANAMFDIVQSGFSSAEALEIAKIAAEAAAAGFTEADVSGRAIVAVLNAFNLSADQSRHIADILFKTVDKGVITFSDLSQNLGDFIGTAAVLKVPLEELGSVMAVLTKRGVPAAEAATSLNRLMLQFLDPSDKAAKAAAKYGIELSAATIAEKGLVGALLEINEAVGGDVEAFGDIFDEVRGLRGITTLMTDDGAELVEILNQMGHASDGAGALAEAFGIRSEALRFKLRRLGSQLLALTDVGGVMNKTLGPFLDWISALIASDNPVIGFLRDAVVAFGALVAIVSLATVVFGALMGALNPFVIVAIGLVAIMHAFGLSWVDLLRGVKDFFVFVADKLGILDNLKLAFQDLKFLIDAFKRGDMMDIAIGIKLLLKNLLGIDIPVKKILGYLRDLEIAWLFFKAAIKDLAKGDLQQFFLDLEQGLKKVFGEKAGTAIFQTVKALTEFGIAVGKFVAWLIPAIVKSEVFALFVEGLRVIFTKIVPFILTKVVPALAKLLKWIGDHKPALIALTIALAALLVWLFPIPAAIIAIITAIGFLSKHWDEIKAKTLAVWQAIKDFLFDVWDGIKNFFMQKFGIDIVAILKIAWDFIRNITVALWNFLSTQFRLFFDTLINIFRLFKAIFTGDWRAAWEAIKNITRNLWDSIKNYFQFIFTVIRTVIETGVRLIWQIILAVWRGIRDETFAIWNGIKATVENVINSIVGFFSGLGGRIGAFIGGIAGQARAVGDAIRQGIADGISGAAGMVADFAQAIAQLFANVINRIVTAVDDAIPDKIEINNFPDINLPDNPLRSIVGFLTAGSFLAKGARNFLGGMAVVGERGPELVKLPRGADVFRTEDIGQAVRGGAMVGGTQVHAEVNLNASLLQDWLALKQLTMKLVEEKLDDAANRAGLAKPRFGTLGVGIPRT